MVSGGLNSHSKIIELINGQVNKVQAFPIPKSLPLSANTKLPLKFSTNLLRKSPTEKKKALIANTNTAL